MPVYSQIPDTPILVKRIRRFAPPPPAGKVNHRFSFWSSLRSKRLLRIRLILLILSKPVYTPRFCKFANKNAPFDPFLDLVYTFTSLHKNNVQGSRRHG